PPALPPFPTRRSSDLRQFAGGLNEGAHAAFAAGADRVLLLNNDTVVAPDALDRLGAALDAVPTAGIAGPLVLDLGDPRRVLSAGDRKSTRLNSSHVAI